MACGQFGAKPLPEPMFVFLSIGHKKQTPIEFEYTKILLENKQIWNYCQWNIGHFFQMDYCVKWKPEIGISI